MKKHNLFLRGLLAGALAALPAVAPAAVNEDVDWDTWPDTWVAVDELGRTVASADAGVTRTSVDANTSVGMFYYIWHGQHADSGKDISELLKADPDNPAWGAAETYHWGSKPWLGYYTAGNRYVVAKHVQMLVDAGVDFMFFDCTNAVVYIEQVQAVLDELARRDELGLRFPRLAFMIHSGAASTAARIYNRFYKVATNSRYWYKVNGKPLMLGPKAEIEAGGNTTVAEFFTWRNSWAWLKGAKQDEWSWLEFYPQKPGWTMKNGVKTTEQISVSVAQHATSKIGKSYTTANKQPKIDKYGMCAETPQGLYFEEQWKEAIRLHPPCVMVTQFNEWIAQRFVIKSSAEYGNVRPGATAKVGESYFVDVYSPEFSRDLEPSTHPTIRDNYYLQLVSNVRKYRGASKIPIPTKTLTIDIAGPFTQWDAETVEYRDDIGDTYYKGDAEQTPNARARTTADLRRAKVVKDADNIYFLIETEGNIPAQATTARWMRLLLNTDLNYSNGWAGYDYMVYTDSKTGQYSLMKNVSFSGKFTWSTVAPVEYRVEGNKMMLAIPREHIGHAGKEADIDFKWADNISDNPDPMDFISEGDAAPNGRFNYRYKGSKIKGVTALPGIVADGDASAAQPELTVAGGELTLAFPASATPASASLYTPAGTLCATATGSAAEPLRLAATPGVWVVRWTLGSATGAAKVVVK